MEDAVAEKMSTRELIRFFGRMLFNQPPENKRAMFDHFLDVIITPPVDGKPSEDSIPERSNRLLKQLEYIFRQFGTDCMYTL